MRWALLRDICVGSAWGPGTPDSLGFGFHLEAFSRWCLRGILPVASGEDSRKAMGIPDPPLGMTTAVEAHLAPGWAPFRGLCPRTDQSRGVNASFHSGATA